MPFDSTKFYLGVNVGWLNNAYRHDLGRGFGDLMSSTPQHDNEFAEIIEAYFAHLEFRQIKVARIWLLEGFEGMTFSGSLTSPFKINYLVDYFGLDNYSTYVEPRIKIVMSKAHEHHIQIYWCLLDPAWLTRKEDMKKHPWYMPLFKFLVEKGRENFKEDILLPFLKSIKPFKANVFAIDIANEVDWCWRKKLLPDMTTAFPEIVPVSPVVARSELVSFVREIREYIREKTQPNPFKCTVSFASYRELTKKTDFDFLDFYDFHRYYYPAAKNKGDTDHDELPKWTKRKSCIIGEAGHHFYYDPKKNIKDQWHAQQSSSKVLMENSLNKGYKGILLWRYTPVSKDKHRLLKLTKGNTGNVSSSETVLKNFLDKFIAAAKQYPFPDPFIDFERPIWREAEKIISAIKQRGLFPIDAP